MKGNKKVIENLNRLLASELTAMDQYFVHAQMYEDWGLGRLYEHTHHEMQEETEHATRLIRRILFLEGVPELTKRAPLKIGKDVPEALKSDLKLEMAVAAQLKEVIELCESKQDYDTREILEDLLRDTEEDHAYWLEKQLGLIKKVGLKNYLQSQM